MTRKTNACKELDWDLLHRILHNPQQIFRKEAAKREADQGVATIIMDTIYKIYILPFSPYKGRQGG